MSKGEDKVRPFERISDSTQEKIIKLASLVDRADAFMKDFKIYSEKIQMMVVRDCAITEAVWATRDTDEYYRVLEGVALSLDLPLQWWANRSKLHIDDWVEVFCELTDQETRERPLRDNDGFRRLTHVLETKL